MNKTEQHIKETLEKRRLSPSESSWGKLSEKLEQKEKSTGKKYWWVGIAAAFLAGIGLASMFFQHTPSLQNTPEITHEIPAEKSEEKTVRPPVKSIVFESKKPKKNQEITHEDIPKKESSFSTKEEPKANQTIALNTSTTSKKKSVTSETVTAKTSKPVTVDQNYIDQKAEEILYNALAVTPNKTTDNEVDKLLQDARKEIYLKEAFANQEIDAQALLDDVEEEIDESFRDRVFKAIQEKINTIRVAVNRNF